MNDIQALKSDYRFKLSSLDSSLGSVEIVGYYQ